MWRPGSSCSLCFLGPFQSPRGAQEHSELRWSPGPPCPLRSPWLGPTFGIYSSFFLSQAAHSLLPTRHILWSSPSPLSSALGFPALCSPVQFRGFSAQSRAQQSLLPPRALLQNSLAAGLGLRAWAALVHGWDCQAFSRLPWLSACILSGVFLLGRVSDGHHENMISCPGGCDKGSFMGSDGFLRLMKRSELELARASARVPPPLGIAFPPHQVPLSLFLGKQCQASVSPDATVES